MNAELVRLKDIGLSLGKTNTYGACILKPRAQRLGIPLHTIKTNRRAALAIEKSHVERLIGGNKVEGPFVGGNKVEAPPVPRPPVVTPKPTPQNALLESLEGIIAAVKQRDALEVTLKQTQDELRKAKTDLDVANKKLDSYVAKVRDTEGKLEDLRRNYAGVVAELDAVKSKGRALFQ